MGSIRRLTNPERRQILRKRAKNASVSAISTALKVWPKTVYNVLSLRITDRAFTVSMMFSHGTAC